MTTLADLYNYIGGDLATSGTGDLQTVTDTLRGQQRVLRRLLTNPGDYIFHPTYGAGLPSYVGRVANIAEITALVRGQMLLEDAVAKSPAPSIAVAPIPSPAGGGFSVTIQYTDAPTGQPVTLSFDVSK
jgi:hypothetical protein